jgi:hypothetical protein
MLKIAKNVFGKTILESIADQNHQTDFQDIKFFEKSTPPPATTTAHYIGWDDFGYFYIFKKNTPEICCIPFKVRKMTNKIFLTQ